MDFAYIYINDDLLSIRTYIDICFIICKVPYKKIIGTLYHVSISNTYKLQFFSNLCNLHMVCITSLSGLINTRIYYYRF